MNKKIRNPEDIPLKEVITSLPIIVTIYDGDDVVREDKMDYSDFEKRKWLGRLSVWAWNEGYTVETYRDK